MDSLPRVASVPLRNVTSRPTPAARHSHTIAEFRAAGADSPVPCGVPLCIVDGEGGRPRPRHLTARGNRANPFRPLRGARALCVRPDPRQDDGASHRPRRKGRVPVFCENGRTEEGEERRATKDGDFRPGRLLSRARRTCSAPWITTGDVGLCAASVRRCCLRDFGLRRSRGFFRVRIAAPSARVAREGIS